MKRVIIIQEVIKQYRVPLYVNLYDLLKQNDVKLIVIYSDPNKLNIDKKDNSELPLHLSKKTLAFHCLDKLVLQFPFWEIVRADLVIVEQANRHVLNYFLIVLSMLGIKKVGFWGHGYNHQKVSNNFLERLKKIQLKKVNWWFAYTSAVASYLVNNGVLPERITNVQNAVDTNELKRQMEKVTGSDISELSGSLRIDEGIPVFLYCGAMYKYKNIDFLLRVIRVYRHKGGEGKFLFVGDGPEKKKIEIAAKIDPQIILVGPKFGIEKAKYFKLSDLMVNPGLVGLAVLDAFAAGLPVFTTSVEYHSPEIEYLVDGRNGRVLETNVESYAESLLNTGRYELQRMGNNARVTSEYYTIERMAKNFQLGIARALKI